MVNTFLFIILLSFIIFCLIGLLVYGILILSYAYMYEIQKIRLRASRLEEEKQKLMFHNKKYRLRVNQLEEEIKQQRKFVRKTTF